ncbi:hypothetical protein ACFQ1E_07230 [Sphingomonas canadensis]|uniref:Lipoprotein n=1 Tax=Sphingomonas canadensis TaxID=1219257 RepID=A0ABW3H4P6_9SPHN|nr:hypothetical protein [Sphingomonas canadensis]MCW3835423.1 hypothetical protein [Sphingomonas canadensis]
MRNLSILTPLLAAGLAACGGGGAPAGNGAAPANAAAPAATPAAAAAAPAAAPAAGTPFAKVGDWEIEKLASGCSAMVLTGSEEGVRLESNATEFKIGFSGLGSAADNAPMKVSYWFGTAREGVLEATAALVPDSNGFEWRTIVEKVADMPSTDGFANSGQVNFAYQVDGKEHVQVIPLRQSHDAVGKLIACSQG